MASKRKLQRCLDVVMTILFLVMMAYPITGNTLHEWLGAVLFLLFFLHHILNRQWYQGLFHGKYPAVRLLGLTVDCLLLVAVIGILVSGLQLSQEVFTFLNLQTTSFGRQLHMLSTSWGFLLISVHLGLHWGFFMAMVGRHSRKQKRYKYLCRFVAVTLSLYGFYAFWTRQLGQKLFLFIEYTFYDYAEPAVFLFLDYIAVMVLFSSLSYYLSKKLRSADERNGLTILL